MLYLTQIRTHTDKAYLGLAEADSRHMGPGRHASYLLAVLAAFGFAVAYIGVIAYSGGL